MQDHHPRSGQPQTPDRASKGDEPLAYPDTCHHCAYPKARDRGQTQAHPAPFAASPDARVRQVRGPATREGCFWAPACEHPRTAAAQVRTAPATTRRGSTATKAYGSRSPCPKALRLIIAATATTAPQPLQIKRQHDTRIERMFRDAMGQRVTRHGGGHRKEAERPEAEEGVPSEAENGDHERDGCSSPRQPGEEGQAETGHRPHEPAGTRRSRP